LGSDALMNIGITGSYGGFSRYRLGMYSSLKIKNWNVGIASENILGRTGQSLLVRLQCAF
jgi:fluoride ion exporter CrcB/FEX